MLLNDFAPLIFQSLLKNNISIRIPCNGRLEFNGYGCSVKTWEDVFPTLVAMLPDFAETLTPSDKQLLQLGGPILVPMLMHLYRAHKAETAPTDGPLDLASLHIDFGIGSESLADVTIFKEHRTGNYFINSNTTGRTVALGSEDLKLKLGVLKKEDIAAVLATANLGKVLYHPGLPSGPQKLSDADKAIYQVQVDYVINTYDPPIWKTLTPTSDVLHPTLDKFFSYLFPKPECRRSVLSWIHSLLYCPMQRLPIMVLYSSGGVGKGTLTERILAPMVGTLNSITGAADQHSNFDSHIGSKHLYAPEEADMKTQERMDRFKAYYDGRVPLSKKFANITQADLIPTRFILSSNFASSLYMIRDARKFTVPDVHKSSAMKDHFSRTEDHYFQDFLLDYQEQCNFAHWIRNNTAPFDNIEDLRHEEDFATLCEYHLTDWFKTLKKMLVLKKEWTHKEVKRALKEGGTCPGITKIKERVAQYEFETRTKLCTFVDSPVDAGIVYKSHIFQGE